MDDMESLIRDATEWLGERQEKEIRRRVDDIVELINAGEKLDETRRWTYELHAIADFLLNTGAIPLSGHLAMEELRGKLEAEALLDNIRRKEDSFLSMRNRNRKIIAMRDSGMKYVDIGRLIGLTASRTRDIYEEQKRPYKMKRQQEKEKAILDRRKNNG